MSRAHEDVLADSTRLRKWKHRGYRAGSVRPVEPDRYTCSVGIFHEYRTILNISGPLECYFGFLPLTFLRLLRATFLCNQCITFRSWVLTLIYECNLRDKKVSVMLISILIVTSFHSSSPLNCFINRLFIFLNYIKESGELGDCSKYAAGYLIG